MKIEVTRQTQIVVNEFMATGRYETEAAALEAALDERIDPHTGITIGALRTLLQAGLDELRAGKGIPAAEVYRILDKRFADHG